jgi:aminobenzoyl-glutamate utilization protein B
MFNVAKGAALMAGVEYDIKLNNGLYEILTNETAKVLQKNMNLVGPIVYTPEEIALATNSCKKTWKEKVLMVQ